MKDLQLQNWIHLAKNLTFECFSFNFHLFQADIMQHIRRLSAEQASVVEEQHYVQYTSLLGAYAGSIRDEKVGLNIRQS